MLISVSEATENCQRFIPSLIRLNLLDQIDGVCGEGIFLRHLRKTIYTVASSGIKQRKKSPLSLPTMGARGVFWLRVPKRCSRGRIATG